VEGTWNGGINFHRNQYHIWSSLARRSRAARWPRNELLARLVGEEAPHELMRDGGEPPIHGSLRPDHRGEVHATRNLDRKKKRQERGVEGGSRDRDRKRGEIGRTLEKYTE
jgi:hypothetical protein